MFWAILRVLQNRARRQDPRGAQRPSGVDGITDNEVPPPIGREGKDAGLGDASAVEATGSQMRQVSGFVPVVALRALRVG